MSCLHLLAAAVAASGTKNPRARRQRMKILQLTCEAQIPAAICAAFIANLDFCLLLKQHGCDGAVAKAL